MSTPGPDDPTAPSQPSAELGGLDPKDLLNAGLETVPPVTLPPQLVDSDATIAVSRPQSTQPRNDAPELPLPEELTNLLPHGNYSVESFLGQGGMGAVYKGMQVRLKRPVAIKIMRRDLGKDHDFEARFEREAQAMAKLNHPNIVSVIDYGEAGPDYLYIVMELVDGADLMDVIRGGQMTQEMALSLLPQICDALQFAHDHGIVHRDIKPSNIMLTRDGRIKMADFGLAKRFDVESSFRTQTGTGMGTPDYAAPEQFSPNSPIDHRADIYALGVMIYQMITGHLPRGVWKPPSQRAKVSTQWDAVVSRAMQSDPCDRYQQASEVKTDVERVSKLVPPDATSAPSPTNAPKGEAGGTNQEIRSTPRSRAPLLIGLITGAVVIAIGAFFALKKPAQTSPSTPSTSAVSPSPPVAEPWVRVWNSPEGLSNAVTLVDGWVVSKTGGTTLGGTLLYPMQWHDSAIRSEWKWAGGPSSGSIGGHMSIREAGKHRYKLSRNKQALLLYRTDDDNVTVLLQEHLVSEPKEDETFTLELRAVGTTLTAKLNGKEVIRVEDDKLTTGGPAVYVFEKGGMRNIEVLNLDQPTVVSSSPSPPTSPIQWQKASWTEEDLRKKTIVADGDWARIGQKAGAPNGWPIAANGETVSFKDGVVRLRYRWEESGRIAVKIRHVGSYGQVVLWGPTIGLGIHINPSSIRYETATLPRPLNDGDEGTLEIAAIGKRLYARVNNSIVLASPEIPELSPTGLCAIHSENGTFRDIEYAILDGIADPLKALGWEVPPTAVATSLDWKKANWTEEDLKKKTIVEDAGWARIGQKAGAANGWPIAANGATVSFKDGVVRLRYRWQGETIVLKTRNEKTFGQVLLWGPHVELGFYLNSTETRLYQKVPLPKPLKVGDEGTLEIAAIGNRLYARLNDSIVLSSPEIPELVPSGFCAIQSVSASFRDVEYAMLDGIPDPLKALGWEEPAADPIADVGWSDLMVEWERYPDRVSSLEKESVKKVTEGWRAAADSGVNATLNDPLGRDLAVRVTARFDPINLSSKTDPGFTVRARRTGPGKIPKQYTGCLFRSGKADLRVSDGNSTDWRVLKSFEMPAGFDPRQSHTIEISTQRDLISFHIDGTLIASVRDATLPPGGRFGMTGNEGILLQKAEYRYLDGVSNPAVATKDAPFINTLGMKFVPVPITGGSTDKQRVLFSVWETRVQDYEAFTKETGLKWGKPKFEQGSAHPAVMMNWEGAQAFCTWLTERERKFGKLAPNERYRLPSDHEWSCAVRLGDREDPAMIPQEKVAKKAENVFPWGPAWPPPPDAGNFSGEEVTGHEGYDGQKVLPGYRDDFPATAPVGSFKADAFGLFDLAGNAREWCEDVWKSEDDSRVWRGSSFNVATSFELMSSYRNGMIHHGTGEHLGFRCVLATDAAPPAGGTETPKPPSAGDTAPANKQGAYVATKDAPFINTLGMKFVPVPITGGPTDGQRVLFSVWETRVQDYEAFVKETKREWPKQNFEQGPTHPAVYMNWENAVAFCTWLTEKEHKAGKLDPKLSYRLPSDHEWSCAVGIGDKEDTSMAPLLKSGKLKNQYAWGSTWPPKSAVENFSGTEAADHKTWEGQNLIDGYRDAFPTTAPVGSFAANISGLYDAGGNVREWTVDDYEAGKGTKAWRGASFRDSRQSTLELSYRAGLSRELRDVMLGFRIILAPANPTP